jgi:hypothetical protein
MVNKDARLCRNVLEAAAAPGSRSCLRPPAPAHAVLSCRGGALSHARGLRRLAARAGAIVNRRDPYGLALVDPEHPEQKAVSKTATAPKSPPTGTCATSAPQLEKHDPARAL